MKLNCQQRQRTAALANSCILSFESSNVRKKNFKQRIRTPKLTCSWVTKINIITAGQSHLPLFCMTNSSQDFQNVIFVLGKINKNKHCQIFSFQLNVYLSQPKVHKNHSNSSQVPKMEVRELHTRKPLHHIISVRINFCFSNFTQLWWFQTIFLGKGQHNTLTFTVKQHLFFHNFKPPLLYVYFSLKKPNGHWTCKKCLYDSSVLFLLFTVLFSQ